MAKIANREAIDAVQELQKGLHFAMDQLINRKDYAEAEVIMRQVDQRMALWISETKQTR